MLYNGQNFEVLDKGRISEINTALKSLAVYRNLLQDRVVKALGAVLGCLSAECAGAAGAGAAQAAGREAVQGTKTGPEEFLELYSCFYYELAGCSKTLSLQDYIIELIIFDENPYSLRVTRGEDLNGQGSLEVAAARDLGCLQRLAALSSSNIKDYAKKIYRNDLEQVIDTLPSWALAGRVEDKPWPDTTGADTLKPQHGNCSTEEANPGSLKSDMYRYIDDIKEYIASSLDWSSCTGALGSFYRQQGAGLFARYRAFVWEAMRGQHPVIALGPGGVQGPLRGIEGPDPVTLLDLIGYQAQREVVLENTLQFLEGYPANNVLLYGDRGTGKSSTVKALLNEYHPRGLRLIEVPKGQLMYFPEIISMVKGRLQKFIIFVDDLSFEDSEDSYTALKAVLEGGLESRPSNVLIYATSNRRHLIKERFTDRQGLQSNSRDDEVRSMDTMQEKLSLSDRFGITAVFTTPDQENYLHLVQEMADRRELSIDRETLRREALKWELNFNGRSPRTARQFVDWLEGKLQRP